MWVSRQQYLDQRDRQIRAEAIVHALRTHNTALQTTMDWMRVRLTQLEHERATLIFQYMGVKVAVPVIEEVESLSDQQQMLHQAISFDDVGDEEAARLGLEWDENGEVFTRKK